MAEPERLRVFIRYDVLRAAELRAVLEGIERAYDQMDHLLTDTRRVRPENRLNISSLHTGNSLDSYLSGNAQNILLLALLIHLLLKERLLYWQSEKTKWDSKVAEKKFQQMDNREEREQQIHTALATKDRRLMKALESLHKLIKQIVRSSHITSIEINVVLGEDIPESEKPKRKITLDDV